MYIYIYIYIFIFYFRHMLHDNMRNNLIAYYSHEWDDIILSSDRVVQFHV